MIALLAFLAGLGVGVGSRYLSTKKEAPLGYAMWSFDKIERLPPAFLRGLVAGLRPLGVDANAVLSVMKHESNFNPQAKNEQMVKGRKRLIAGGLIQWIHSTAKAYGTTLEHLLTLDAMGQLPYVLKYWETMAKTFPSRRDRWTPEQALRAVFFPSSVGKPDDWAIGVKDAAPKDDSEAAAKAASFIRLVYEQNAGLDRDKDGRITAGEVDLSAKKVYIAAKSRPPILI